MRIAFYAPLKPPTHGTPSGDRRVARLLIEALRLGGHVVALASEFRSFEGTGDAARQDALRVEASSIAQTLIKRWQHEAPHERPELWFTYHLYYKAPDWLGPAICSALHIPYVVAEASYAAKRAQGPWSVGHAATRSALAAASLVFCPTRDDVEGVLSAVGADTRVRRLAPFVDSAIYESAAGIRSTHRSQLSVRHGLPDDRPWIVVAAMMRPGDKLASYRMLAEALGELGDLPWTLVVAGDGAARSEVETLLRRAAEGRVWFLGRCSAEALAGVFAACDVCVWPSVNEAYGMAMLEAQAAGLPVVACAVRGVPDVVMDGHTGLLATAGDVRGMAAHLRRLLMDEGARHAMGQAAARFVRDERGLAQAAQTLNASFSELHGSALLLP